MLPALPLEITCEVICDFILCEPVRGKSSLQWQRRLAETPVQGFQRGSCPTRSEFEDTTRVKAQLRSRGATLPVKPPQVWQVSLQLASMREQLMPKIVREGACRARSFKAPPFSPCPRARNPHVALISPLHGLLQILQTCSSSAMGRRACRLDHHKRIRCRHRDQWSRGLSKINSLQKFGFRCSRWYLCGRQHSPCRYSVVFSLQLAFGLSLIDCLLSIWID